ncbi:large-conductance mechanosensitive channel protein MscL [Neisseria sp. Ec49-e6-T10]|uniref:large-conductance mechanosensitive channel protein MscL n=1 Tax=Neisseria sp. Ec49-e6-T10 TaxID=3140744 RepID=UPI003EBBB361
MGFLKDFRDFAMRGNVIDLAVGVVIGGAFGKIVSSLVSDIIMPLLGYAISGLDFKDLSITLPQVHENLPAVTLKYGMFVQSIVDFTIIAFAIFIFIRLISKLKKETSEAAVEPTAEEKLLTEIRDLLKNK